MSAQSKMRYFFDTEFIEDGKTIDLISIGIVAEDGREFYGINWECDFDRANGWVRQNVLPFLPFRPTAEISDLDTSHWYTRSQLKKAIALFMGCDLSPYKLAENSPTPEIWAYYADYDWVAFCQIFGQMINLPTGLPMYCRDLKQWCDDLGNPSLPKQEQEHHALANAQWNKQVWEFLQFQSEIQL
jgi:hypothetical protein